MEKTLREICSEVGVSRRAVQGYQTIGLVTATGKNKYGHLLYDQNAIDRIKTIYFYQETEMSLSEILEVIDAPPDKKKEILSMQLKKMEAHREKLHHLIDKLNQHIAEL